MQFKEYLGVKNLDSFCCGAFLLYVVDGIFIEVLLL